ncbi:MAG: imelysin [Saprospiraceae bacterium]|nr:imelysin [Saprospiraceae bacterium]
MKYLKSIFVLLGIFNFISCSKDSIKPAVDYSDVLSNSTNQVIINTYKDLNDKSKLLLIAIDQLKSNTSAGNLELARSAWRNSRIPWEQSEGFLFGPVDQQGIDPSIDSWPVNVVDLDAVMASPDVLNKTYVDALEGTLKGFHTIEYLLFGENGNKQLAEFNTRQFEYLSACTQSLNGSTQQLFDAWRAEGQNFGKNLIEAGKLSSIYPSQKSALQELVDGMITIADEVANGKINDPFVQSDILKEESRFSANSKADFADNIRSIKNIYLGSLDGSGSITGFYTLLHQSKVSLHQKIVNQIEAAIAAIESIPGTFTTAITLNRPAIQFSQDQVRALQLTLESELKPFIDTF